MPAFSELQKRILSGGILASAVLFLRGGMRLVFPFYVRWLAFFYGANGAPSRSIAAAGFCHLAPSISSLASQAFCICVSKTLRFSMHFLRLFGAAIRLLISLANTMESTK